MRLVQSKASNKIHIKSHGPFAMLLIVRISGFMGGKKTIGSEEIKGIINDRISAPDIISKVEMASGLAR